MLTTEEQSSVRDAIARVQQQASAALQTRRSAERSVDFVAVLHANIDTAIRQEIANGPKPECKAGCSHCCSLRVEVSDPEALKIAHYLRSKSKSALKQVRRRLEANAEFHRLRVTETGSRMACAFLEANHCTIYAVRPATCRKAHSLSVNACETSATVLPQNLAIVMQCEVLIAGTNNAFRELNLSASRLELSAGVLAAMSTPRAAEAWYQGAALLGTPPQSGAGACDVA